MIDRSLHRITGLRNVVRIILAASLFVGSAFGASERSEFAPQSQRNSVLELRASLASGSVVSADPKRLRSADSAQFQSGAAVLPLVQGCAAPALVAWINPRSCSHSFTAERSPGLARSPPSQPSR